MTLKGEDRKGLLVWYSKRRHTDMLKKKTVDDINVKGKRVLVRCDFNVPLKDARLRMRIVW